MRYRRLPTTGPTPRDLQEPIYPRKKCAIWTRWRLVPGKNVNYPMFLGRPSRYGVALLDFLTLTHDEQNKSHHHYATESVPVHALPPTLHPEK